MSDEIRRDDFCDARIELEDVTDAQARAFWQALDGHTVTIGDLEATIHLIESPPTGPRLVS